MSDSLDDELFDDGDLTGTEEAAQPFFPNVYVFVRDHLVHVIERDASKYAVGKWCPRWFEHPEAVSRLESLWKAFEALRQDPGTGASSWWRDHADPTMAALSAGHGPFRSCDEDKHELGVPLPMEEPPEWLIHSGGPENT